MNENWIQKNLILKPKLSIFLCSLFILVLFSPRPLSCSKRFLNCFLRSFLLFFSPLFPSFPRCYLALPSLHFMFHCFVLLLLVPSLGLHFALAYSFTFWPIVTYSICHTSPCYCLFYPSYLALLLPTSSLAFYSACSLLRTSPYYCLLLPSHFTFLLPPPSLTLCPTVACYLLVPSHFVPLCQPKILLLLTPPCFVAYSFTFHLIACLV